MTLLHPFKAVKSDKKQVTDKKVLPPIAFPAADVDTNLKGLPRVFIEKKN